MSPKSVPSTHLQFPNGLDPAALPVESVSATPADLKTQIHALITTEAIEVFDDAINHITGNGSRPSEIERWQRVLRDIVSQNLQIASLYNALAVSLASIQIHPESILPLFLDLKDGAGNDDKSEKEMEDGPVVRHAVDLKLEGSPVSNQVLGGGRKVFGKTGHEVTVIRGDHKAEGLGFTEDEDQKLLSAAAEQQVSNGNPSINLQNTCPSSSKVSEQGEVPAGKLLQKAANVYGQNEPFHHDTSNYTPQTRITHVQNPEAFPISRIQEIQALYYPSAKITAMRVFGTNLGSDTIVTAVMEDGPFNHILINDARLIKALGLDQPPNNTLTLQPSQLRTHETFTIIPLSTHDPKKMENFLVGELVPARHAFLHWLDSRGLADPTRPPFVQEAKRLAVSIRRRALDVWCEIEEYWHLEQGPGGARYRMNRVRYLGEDPKYPGGEEKRPAYGMW